jgi:hypothetical protein
VRRLISNRYCSSIMTIGDRSSSFPAISDLENGGKEAPASSYRNATTCVSR